MSPASEQHTNTVVRSREQVIRDRRRRQTYTFASVFALVFLIGLVALGNWQAWWTIGGSAQAATICPEQTVTLPRYTNVNVINTTDRKGLAAAVAKELQKRQFIVLSIASESPDKPFNMVAEIRYGVDGKVAARTIGLQFPKTIKMVQDDREEDSVDVRIGEKYKGMVSGKKGAEAIRPVEEPRGCIPPTTAPATTPAPSAS
jgi:hypothetical protein